MIIYAKKRFKIVIYAKRRFKIIDSHLLCVSHMNGPSKAIHIVYVSGILWSGVGRVRDAELNACFSCS